MANKITIKDIHSFKFERRKFVTIACYDYLTAKIAALSAEALLVGDSAAQHLLGYENTLGAKMDFMVEITAAVRRGAPEAFIIADMPFLSYQCGIAEAVKNAGRFVVEGGADIVKIETTQAYINVIKAVSDAGILTMPHIGIRPQTNIFSAKGTTLEQAVELLELSERLVEAGASMLLLEGTAAEVAKAITEKVTVPVIGCGSGAYCDGNVLISPDILGLSEGKKPKFSKSFGNVGQAMKDAFDEYAKAIRSGAFPDDDHCYHIKGDHLEQFKKLISEEKTE